MQLTYSIATRYLANRCCINRSIKHNTYYPHQLIKYETYWNRQFITLNWWIIAIIINIFTKKLTGLFLYLTAYWEREVIFHCLVLMFACFIMMLILTFSCCFRIACKGYLKYSISIKQYFQRKCCSAWKCCKASAPC